MHDSSHFVVVVQAEITSSEMFLVPFHSAKYHYLYSYWYFAEQNGTKSGIKLTCLLYRNDQSEYVINITRS